MNLVHIVPAIAQEASGPTYSVKRLCEALLAEGESVTLAALDWIPLPSPPSYLRTFPLGLGPRRLGRSPKMRRWLEQSVRAGTLQVIHNHGMWQMNSVYPAWAARNGHVGLVYSPRGALSAWAMQHGSAVKRIFWPLLQRPALQSAACFHATAESEYLDIRRLGFRQPVAIVPNGIDIPEPGSRPSEDAPRTLLFLGRVHVVKGLDLLLPAWRLVQERHPDWRLVIAGDDNGYNGVSGHLEELKRLARQIGAQRVEFTGALYGAAKQRAYRSADLYVLPSRSENFAVTVAEALSMGIPAAVSTGAPWGGLAAAGAGWSFEPEVAPLAECLDRALACPRAELQAMGRSGRNWMEEDFSWQRIAQRMALTYRWIADRTLPVPAWVRLN